MKMPDKTERFPEGIDGIDETNKYFGEAEYNHRDIDAIYDYEMADIIRERIEDTMEEYKIKDYEKAKEIVELEKDKEEIIGRITRETREKIEAILNM